jgi:hypothetical protein
MTLERLKPKVPGFTGENVNWPQFLLFSVLIDYDMFITFSRVDS